MRKLDVRRLIHFPMAIEFPKANLVVRVHDKPKSFTTVDLRRTIALPCKIDADFVAQHRLRLRDSLFLPKVYAALSHFTAADDGCFDPWKGSFGFRFFLSVEKNGTVSNFMHRVFQYRTGFRAPLYQLRPKLQDDSVHSNMGGHHVRDGPPAEMFSQADFEGYSAVFLERLLDELERTGYQPDPFLITAASEYEVAGFADGKYFQEHALPEEDFTRFVDAWKKKGLRVVS
jgi:hypothetical protein